MPALSLTGATGKTTSATLGDPLSRSSRATTNDARSSAARNAARVGGVVGVDATDDERRGRRRRRPRPRSRRRRGRPPRAGCRRPTWWRRRRGQRRRRPAGRRAAGWAGSPPRPHRGRRRAGAPRRAWRRSSPRPRRRRSRRPARWPAARPPGSPARVESVVGVAEQACSASASRRAWSATSWPSSFWRPRDANGAIENTRVRASCATSPCAAAGRSRRLRPRARGRPARRSRRPRGRRTSRPAGEHDLGRRGRRLLGRERPGAEVDVVGAEGDAGELAVGEGVLGGQPAAGQHRRRAGLGEPAGGDGERLRPGGRAQLAARRRGPGAGSGGRPAWA